ncbi:MAG TPA: hypothetical protein VKA15_04305, partial [Isosphaeraceae bacterium]|nr:hypothetical protein [Isosphaeraceae bacterium]
MRFMHEVSKSRHRRRTARDWSLETLEDRTVPSLVLSANPGPPGEIDLSWTPVSNAAYYQIQSSYNGTDFYT